MNLNGVDRSLYTDNLAVYITIRKRVATRINKKLNVCAVKRRLNSTRKTVKIILK